MPDEPLFFETLSTVHDMEVYSSSLRCLKDVENDSLIWGNFNTGNARALLIMFEKCDRSTSATVCESEEEINNWLEGRYILVLEN